MKPAVTDSTTSMRKKGKKGKKGGQEKQKAVLEFAGGKEKKKRQKTPSADRLKLPNAKPPVRGRKVGTPPSAEPRITAQSEGL